MVLSFKMPEKKDKTHLLEVNESGMKRMINEYKILKNLKDESKWGNEKLGKFKNLYEYHRGEYLKYGGDKNKYTKSIEEMLN